MFRNDKFERLDERGESSELLDEEIGVDEGVELLEHARRHRKDVGVVIERRLDARAEDGARRRRHHHDDGDVGAEVTTKTRRNSGEDGRNGRSS